MHNSTSSQSAASTNRLLKYRTLLPILTALAPAVLHLTLTGCSHTTPYYHPDMSPPAQTCIAPQNIRYRILLVGDAGDTHVSASTLSTLHQWASEIPRKTLIVFLGDNIYPLGMPPEHDPDRPDAQQRLLAQLAVVQQSTARALFIPGNHDWANGQPQGQDAVRRQEAYINQTLQGHNNFLPKNGCPGPAAIDLPGVRVIVLDTMWWLHKHHNNTACCPQKDAHAVTQQLKTLLATAGDRQVLVVAHHPLATHGAYGGFYDWKDHLFPATHLAKWLWLPTPLVGSLYPFFRSHVIKNEQSLASQPYQNMIQQLTEALATNKPLIYAAGHDHGLQVLKGQNAAQYILVSALGLDKAAALTHGPDTLFAHLHPGFIALDFNNQGHALLRVVEPGPNGVAFLMWLQRPSQMNPR